MVLVLAVVMVLVLAVVIYSVWAVATGLAVLKLLLAGPALDSTHLI